MARFETFDQDIRLATADLEPEAISQELAKFARASLAEAISSGQGSPIYEKFINSRPGAAEETVIAPGPIVYEFSWWPEIIEFALEYLRKRSPVRSGKFRDSWFVLVNDARIVSAADIPIDARVTITNNQPYARKIEVGHMQMSVPHGVAEDARVAVRRLYGSILDVRKTFVTLAGGYVLKGHFRRGVRKFSRTRLRPDAGAGSKMLYPALVLAMKA